MKVLHLTTHLNVGGITSYLQSLGKAQLKRGHEVSILCSGGALLEDLQAAGVRCHVYPIRTKNEIHPKLYFHLVGILRLVQAEKFDVIHAHTRVTQVLASIVSKSTRTPYVSTAHGFYKPKLGRKIFPSWGDRVIAISPLVAQELKNAHGVQEQKIITIQNAIDVEELESRLAKEDRLEVRKEYGIPPSAVVVSCISRLVEDKGHAYLIEAVLKLVKDFPQIHLVIVGDGREKEALEKKAGVEAGKRIHFIASLKNIAGILKITDIFAHPATYREGFGLSVAEAMVANIPVIVTDIPAINAIIQNGKTGLVVSPKNSEMLAQAIAFLLQDPQAAKQIAESGRQMARELCSLERLVNEIEEVYEKVIKEYEKP